MQGLVQEGAPVSSATYVGGRLTTCDQVPSWAAAMTAAGSRVRAARTPVHHAHQAQMLMLRLRPGHWQRLATGRGHPAVSCLHVWLQRDLWDHSKGLRHTPQALCAGVDPWLTQHIPVTSRQARQHVVDSLICMARCPELLALEGTGLAQAGPAETCTIKHLHAEGQPPGGPIGAADRPLILTFV